MWGQTGILRMFGSDVGGQVAWLLPAALILLGAGLWFTRHAPRTDLQRAGLLVWGGWLLVTGLTFSFMAGIFHAYYTVALAPAIGALVGIGTTVLWRRREEYAAALVMSCTLAFTTAFSFMLLDRTPDYVPWLKWLVAVVGVSAALLVVGVGHLPQKLALVVAGAALVAGLAAPTAYAVTTAGTAHTGSIPSAGPSSGAGPGGFGGGRPGGRTGMPPTQPGATGGATRAATTGGLLEGSQSSAAITAMLRTDADAYTWAAAAIGSNSAAGYQLASEQPVMAIGGFNGSDPSPTLAQFQAYVQAGKIHYFLGGGGFGGGQSGGSNVSSQISSWVQQNFTAVTIGGSTFYDLTQPASGTTGATSSTGTV